MTRSDHVEWCKQRALEYCDKGDLKNALNSMISNLNKHEETERHAGIHLGIGLAIAGKLNTQAEMRKFIEGFN